MLNKGEMTVEKAIDVMSDTGFFSPASCYSEEEQLAALYLAIRILEEKAEEEAKMQEKAPETKTTGKWAYYFCPVCHQEVAHKQKYCSNCGMSIIWPI